jgi:hypothetical protein
VRQACASLGRVSYLVLFVADAADDRHADALRSIARTVEGAGFFDDPALDGLRTVGTYLRTDDPGAEAALALVARVAAMSQEHAVRIEVQHAEAVLGHIESGLATTELAAALAPG